jgi:hypothetical protein
MMMYWLYTIQSVTFVPLTKFLGVICNTILRFLTDFFCMTKSVINQLGLYSLRKYEQLFYWSIWHFDYKHANSILITTMQKNIDDKKMTVHFSEGHFEIIVIQIRSCYSFFRLSNPRRFHLLCFTTEQLSLNPENFR